jgi:hypothetical protein
LVRPDCTIRDVVRSDCTTRGVAHCQTCIRLGT